MNDEDLDVLSPRRAPGAFAQRHDSGALSPSVRHPKARRSLMGSDGAIVASDGDFGSAGYGRGSPNPFQPITRGRSSPAPLAPDGRSSYDHDSFSMAGQTNVSELRRAAQMSSGCDPDPMIKACVKVFVTQVTPSYAVPWARGEEARSTGSGFVVSLPPLPNGESLHPNAAAAAAGARCIVTNAHVVENHSLIQVRSAGKAEKYVARPLSIAHDCDLAILLVEDEHFWHGLHLVSLESTLPLPRLASEVVAVGFPVGGDDVSATRGVVSRILVGGLTDNLCVQIDAAINPVRAGSPSLP
jgi:S1-C subfamily serine protease